MSDLKVRPAVSADLRRLWLFDALSSNDGEPRYEPQIWTRSVERGEVFIAATPENRPAGFLLFERRGRSLHINEVFVAEKHRGEGIGHDFMKALCEKADADGHSVNLEVAKANKDAISLYRHFDFSVSGALASTHIVMERPARACAPI